MSRRFFYILFVLSVFVFSTSNSYSEDMLFLNNKPLEQQQAYRAFLVNKDDANAEITYLIEMIRSSPHAFIRNGKTHNATKAADHVQKKFKRMRFYIKSTEDFIEHCASKSSMTGRDYLIENENHETYVLRDVLHSELRRLRQKLKQDQVSILENSN